MPLIIWVILPNYSINRYNSNTIAFVSYINISEGFSFLELYFKEGNKYFVENLLRLSFLGGSFVLFYIFIFKLKVFVFDSYFKIKMFFWS